jgi:hypothetical protein
MLGRFHKESTGVSGVQTDWLHVMLLLVRELKPCSILDFRRTIWIRLPDQMCVARQLEVWELLDRVIEALSGALLPDDSEGLRGQAAR